MKERGLLKEMLKYAQYSSQQGYFESLINQNDVNLLFIVIWQLYSKDIFIL